MRFCFVSVLLLTLLGAVPLAWSGTTSVTDENPVAQSARKFPLPEVETLPNGLKLVLFPHENLPLVDLTLVVRAGFRDDPDGKSGLAELTAKLLDRGAAGMTAQVLGRSIEMLGGARSIYPEDDAIILSMHGLEADSSQLLELLAKMAIYPEFPETEVSRQKEVIRSEWSHIGDYSEAMEALIYNRLIAFGTSYGRGNLNSEKELVGIAREDLVRFHRKFFTPKNSILMVVGRLEKEALRQKIKAVFGTWTGEAPIRSRKTFKDPRFSESRPSLVIVDHPGQSQAQVKVGFQIPMMSSSDRNALGVANAIVGEGFSNRLNTIIRDKLGLTYVVNSSLSYRSEIGDFTVTTSTRNEHVGQLVMKVIDVLKDFKKGPILPAEVDRAKKFIKGGYALQNSTLNAIASRWLVNTFFGFGPEYMNEFGSKVDAVSVEEVQQSVVKAFDLDHLVVVVSGDAKVIKKNLNQISHLKMQIQTPETWGWGIRKSVKH